MRLRKKEEDNKSEIKKGRKKVERLSRETGRVRKNRRKGRKK